MHRSSRATMLVLLAAAACGDPSLVRIVDEMTPDGQFLTRDVRLQTMRNLDSVEGATARFIGGAELKTSLDFAPLDGGGSRDRVASGGREVSARWTPDGDVAVPLDFDTLAMFSGYAHLEEASLHFAALGVPAPATTRLPVYFAPTLVGDTAGGTTDNAAYLVSADGFLLLPSRYLPDIPLAMNPGVMAHEYAHRVWYFIAWRGEMFLRLQDATADFAPQWNLSRATDEGVADFFGAAISGDPQFVSRSAMPVIAKPRDLTQVRSLVPSWVDGTWPIEGGVYYPYAVGAVVASTLWGVAGILGFERVEKAVLDAEAAIADGLAGLQYAVGDFEVALLGTLDPIAERPQACDRFAQSYEPVWSRFAEVCP